MKTIRTYTVYIRHDDVDRGNWRVQNLAVCQLTTSALNANPSATP